MADPADRAGPADRIHPAEPAPPGAHPGVRHRLRGQSAAILLATAAIVLVLDLATKSVANASLPSDRSVPVLGDFLRLTLVHNTGAAFGLFPGSGGTFVVFSVAAIGLILFLYWRLPAQNFLQLLAMGALLGGALGNLHDRVRSGVVVDFIDVGFGTLRWPVFNFADIAVTAGVGLLLLGVARRPV